MEIEQPERRPINFHSPIERREARTMPARIGSSLVTLSIQMPEQIASGRNRLNHRPSPGSLVRFKLIISERRETRMQRACIVFPRVRAAKEAKRTDLPLPSRASVKLPKPNARSTSETR